MFSHFYLDAIAVTISFHACVTQNNGGCINEYVEWKQIYDVVDYTFGDATKSSSVFDFQSIACHENGHVMGLKDIYLSQCSYVTMYGYASPGQTTKRNPSAEDIQGICQLGYPCETDALTANAAAHRISRDQLFKQHIYVFLVLIIVFA